MKFILLTLATLFFSLVGNACTMCNSKTATDVRAVIFGDNFMRNIFFTVLPFIVFTAIILFMYKGGKAIKFKY